MKRNLILVMVLLPFLALGQSNFHNNSGDGYEKSLNDGASNNLERQLQTTLINDVKHDKSLFKLNLGKSYALSLTIKNDKTFNTLDDNKLDEMLLKLKHLKNFKRQFGEPIHTNELFENKERNN